MRVADRPGSGTDFENMLTQAFRKAGWRVRRPPSVADSGADLILDANGNQVAQNDNGAPDGRNALLSYTSASGGAYYVKVSSTTASSSAGLAMPLVKSSGNCAASFRTRCATPA